MAVFKKLAQSIALSPGSDLWIVPDSNNCAWTKKIDWYLNFQLTRTNERESLRLPPQLLRILQQNPNLDHFDQFEYPVKELPLFVASSRFLPNHQTVEINYNGDLKPWLKSAYDVWSNLNKPSLRLFLPLQFSEEQVLELWPKGEEFEIGLVTN